jgi:hypothetical protein
MSSASMALAGTGHGWNPGSLNSWLRDNGGYYDGGMYLWASINSLGISFEGKVSNGLIKSKLDQGKVVICNVRGGGHWVLAYAYDGDTIYVNDSGFSTNYYPMSQIVDGQNGIYGVYGSSYYNILNKLKNIRSNEDLDKMADGGNITEAGKHN